MLVAGEPSGDALGAKLMRGLIDRSARPVAFFGVGGDAMIAAGLESQFPMRELSVMGLAEVLPRVPGLWRRMRGLVRAIRAYDPDAVVTIDSPGFNLRLAARLRPRSYPLIHYVAPQIWAWRPGRAGRIAARLDRLLALMPFEPPLFEAAGLPCDIVGHPILEDWPEPDAAPRAAGRHLLVLPGSRGSELRRLLPVFAETVRRLHARWPDLRVSLPTLPHHVASLRAATRAWPVPVSVLQTVDQRRRAMLAADAALSASGTVTLELGLAGVPTVVGYRVAPATAFIARRLIRVERICLVNILLRQTVFAEFVQGDCTADRLSDALAPVLADPEAARRRASALGELPAALGAGTLAPSLRAAEAVLRTLQAGRAASRPTMSQRG